MPYRKIKWIKDLNMRTETIKTLEECRGKKFSDTGPGNIFLGMSPKTRKTKAKINY